MKPAEWSFEMESTCKVFVEGILELGTSLDSGGIFVDDLGETAVDSGIDSAASFLSSGVGWFSFFSVRRRDFVHFYHVEIIHLIR